MARYVPHTEDEVKTMLEEIGYSDLEELFRPIPQQVRLKTSLRIPNGLSEWEAANAVKEMAAKNTVFPVVLRGAGAYKHFIPSVVKHIASREEFLTAYTPYQPEISQGILQSIFEYQTMICDLTGMDTSNASVYDGATAAAEAMKMCVDKKRHIAMIAETIHPQMKKVLETYARCADIKILYIPEKDGVIDLAFLESNITKETACVFVQQPNFYGQLEDTAKIGEIAHSTDAKYILSCNPISLALLNSPGEVGADIAVGEGQPLGMPLSFGGPYLGFLACKKALVRKMPGRIVGQTTDLDGKPSYVLTLQAREQHIRREKAGSSICSNQALCALTASAYLAAMGPIGLTETAKLCFQKAHYFAAELTKIGFVSPFKGEFFHEFVTSCPSDSGKVLKALEEAGILGGLPLSNDLAGHILWCVTEVVTKEQMDQAIRIIKGVMA